MQNITYVLPAHMRTVGIYWIHVGRASVDYRTTDDRTTKSVDAAALADTATLADVVKSIATLIGR